MDRVERFIDRHHMFSTGETAVVAVSGGIDSCVLLDVLERLGRRRAWTLVVAHVNHGLRGAESDRDEAFVSALAESKGLRFVSTRLKSLKAGKGRKESIQVAARRARYEFLFRVRTETGARVVAFGHTRTDQAETVLQRVIRGTGIDGVAAMGAVRDGWVVRPLLCAGRDEVDAYAGDRSLEWVEDSSNVSPAYTRNRIRHRIWPVILAENPRLEEALSGLADTARRDADLLDKLAGTVWNSGAVTIRPGQVTLDRARLLDIHPALRFRLLRLAVGEVQRAAGTTGTVGRVHLDRAVTLVEAGEGTAWLSLPGAVTLEVGPGQVTVTTAARPAPDVPRPIALVVPGATDLPGGGRIVASLLPREAFAPKAREHRVCWLDAAVLSEPLYVRRPEQGDRFHPYGAPGPMRLSRFFIREKVPRLDRPAVPLVFSGRRIVWVVGMRGAEFGKVMPSTQRILKLVWMPPE